MISRKFKCIFIHIPKTAGTSIEQKLEHFHQLSWNAQDHRTIRSIQPINIIDLVDRGSEFEDDNYTLPDMVKTYLRETLKPSPILSRSEYKHYFKFTFVRNSWSRIFSWYKNVIRDQRQSNRLNIPCDCSFKNFLLNHLDHEEASSQLFWLLDRQGNVAMDFIGRFENLTADFAKICEILGIDDPFLPELVRSPNQSY